MYILFAFISLIGFVLTDVLFAGPSRKLDGYSVSFYRSASLIITMLPILLIFDVNFNQITLETLFQFLLVGFAGAGGIVFHLQSYKYLPIGIAGSIMKLSTILVMLFGYFYWGEQLSIVGIIGTVLILGSVIGLSLLKNNQKHLDNNQFLGVLFSILTAISGSLWFIGVTYFGKELSVGLSAYFAEAMIFVALVILLPINKLISGKYLLKTSNTNYLKIFIYSSTALLGTGAYTYASVIGNISVTSIILATTSVFVSILGYIFFKEKLSLIQIVLIGTTVLGLILVSL